METLPLEFGDAVPFKAGDIPDPVCPPQAIVQRVVQQLHHDPPKGFDPRLQHKKKFRSRVKGGMSTLFYVLGFQIVAVPRNHVFEQRRDFRRSRRDSHERGANMEMSASVCDKSMFRIGRLKRVYIFYIGNLIVCAKLEHANSRAQTIMQDVPPEERNAPAPDTAEARLIRQGKRTKLFTREFLELPLHKKLSHHLLPWLTQERNMTMMVQ